MQYYNKQSETVTGSFSFTFSTWLQCTMCHASVNGTSWVDHRVATANLHRISTRWHYALLACKAHQHKCVPLNRHSIRSSNEVMLSGAMYKHANNNEPLHMNATLHVHNLSFACGRRKHTKLVGMLDETKAAVKQVIRRSPDMASRDRVA